MSRWRVTYYYETVSQSETVTFYAKDFEDAATKVIVAISLHDLPPNAWTTVKIIKLERL